MSNAIVAGERLRRQYITRPGPRRAAEVVARLGAVQAQEYPFAHWALGLRMPAAATSASIAGDFDAGGILRTHVMRPTWHFVTPEDIRWMLELTAPRVQRAMGSYHRRLGLDAALLTRATGVIERAVGEHGCLTRRELAAHLAQAGLALDPTRLAHVVMHAELERVVCSGPRRGRQFTYALLAARAPRARRLQPDEALGELAGRFFRSHGPATIRDFVWWSGLTTGEAKRGLEMHRATRLDADGLTYWAIGRVRARDSPGPTVHLLPIYDEYLVAYRDRRAVPHPPLVLTPPSRAAVVFQHALVIDGQVAGTWRTGGTRERPQVDVFPVRRLTRAERGALGEAFERYQRFADVPLSLKVNGSR